MRKVGKDKINLLIDDDQFNFITTQVVYDIVNHILWNNSADLNEHPVQLSFDRKYADGFDQCRKG